MIHEKAGGDEARGGTGACRPAARAGWGEAEAIVRRRLVNGWYAEPPILEEVARRILRSGDLRRS